MAYVIYMLVACMFDEAFCYNTTKKYTLYCVSVCVNLICVYTRLLKLAALDAFVKKARKNIYINRNIYTTTTKKQLVNFLSSAHNIQAKNTFVNRNYFREMS